MDELTMLRNIAEMVLLWAKSPGDHGGNPYTKEFVRLVWQWEKGFPLNNSSTFRTTRAFVDKRGNTI